MKGERLAWYQVASHLGRSVRELREAITISEFLGWIDFLEWEQNRRTKLDLYLARIAMEIRMGNVKEPLKVNLDEFLIGGEKREEVPRLNSKQIWLKGLGLEED